MNRRMFISSLIASAAASQTAILPVLYDEQALARIMPSAAQIMVYRFGEWVPVLNLTAVKIGEFIYKTDHERSVVLPLVESGDFCGKVTGAVEWIAENKCWGVMTDSFSTFEELYEAMGL